MRCAALFVGCAYAYAALTLAHLTASVLVLGGIVVSVVGVASFAVALCWKRQREQKGRSLETPEGVVSTAYFKV